MKQGRRIPTGTAVMIGVVLTTFFISAVCFRKMNERAVLERNADLLREHTEHHTEMAVGTLEARLRFVQNLAELLMGLAEPSGVAMDDMLAMVSDNTIIDDLFFVNEKGLRCYHDGTWSELDSAEFFQQGIQGESGITQLADSQLKDGEKYIAYYAPVTRDGKTDGVVVGCNYYGSMNEFLGMDQDEKYLYSFLTDQDGNILLANVQPEREELFSFLKERMEPKNYKEFLDDMKNSKTGYAKFKGKYGKGLVCFCALGINNSYIIQIFSSAKTSEMTSSLNRSAYSLELVMLLCLLFAVGYTVYLTYGRYNQKKRLIEMTLTALAVSFPSIASINCRSGSCFFVREEERFGVQPFQKCDWEGFRQKFLQTVHPEDHEKCRLFTSVENMRRIINQGMGGDTCIYRRTCGDGYQWMQMEIIPLKGDEETVLIYARKVSESVKAEEYYKAQLLDAAQKAKKAEIERSEYLKYASCHLRIPMKALIRMSQQNEVNCEYMETTSRYVLTVLDDMIQIGIMQERQLRCRGGLVCVPRLAQLCRVFYEETDYMARGIQFEVSCPEEITTLYEGDEARILQILVALVSNALQFNREGGSVRLRIALLEAGEKEDSFQFEVSDTGIGISPEFLPRIFEPYAKENADPGENAGMGLFLTKLALDAMGAEMEVKSTSGEGSCFTFCLTLPHAPDRFYRKVLVADDNRLSLEVMTDTLEQEGCTVTGCSTGEEALERYLASEPGDFDLVLADMKMPGMCGLELAERIRNAGRADSGEVCIVAVAFDHREKILDQARQCGVEEVLEKPFRMVQLKQFLHNRKEP